MLNTTGVISGSSTRDGVRWISGNCSAGDGSMGGDESLGSGSFFFADEMGPVANHAAALLFEVASLTCRFGVEGTRGAILDGGGEDVPLLVGWVIVVSSI